MASVELNQPESERNENARKVLRRAMREMCILMDDMRRRGRRDTKWARANARLTAIFDKIDMADSVYLSKNFGCAPIDL
jgi:hypothetical protein